MHKTEWTNYITPFMLLALIYGLHFGRGSTFAGLPQNVIDITTILVIPFLIFYVVHYLSLKILLKKQFPFETMRLKHIEREPTTTRFFGYKETQNWIKHQYSLFIYAISMIITYITILAIQRFNINIALTTIKLIASHPIEQINNALSFFGKHLDQQAIISYIYVFTLFTLIITLILMLLSRAILNRSLAQSILPVLIASIISFIAIIIYFWIIAPLLPSDFFSSIDTDRLMYGINLTN